MTKSNSKRKTRSDKFTLTLHKTGQYCKKIRGKLYYFGTNSKAALERYLEQTAYLYTGRGAKPNLTNSLSLKTLCSLYLDHQNSKVLSRQITAQHYRDQVSGLRMLARFLGQYRLVGEICC